MTLAVAVSLALSGLTACDQKPPSAPTPAPQGNVDVTLVLTPRQTRAVEGLAPSLSIRFADVQARNVCGPSACLTIFIPLVVLDITGESTPAVQRKLALPSQLATDNVPSVTTVGTLRIELTSLDPSFTAPLDYRATFRVTSRIE
jgi:hypothetical protein